MMGLVKSLAGAAFALILAGPALAAETPSQPPVAPASAAPPALEPSAREKAMAETLCRSLEDEDTGHHVRHRTCMTRAEWVVYDKNNLPS